MAEMTYNEVRNAIDVILNENRSMMQLNTTVLNAFNHAADVLAKAESAESMLRTTGPEIEKLIEDKRRALAEFHTVSNMLSARRAELEKLNRDAAREKEQREAALELAVNHQIARMDELRTAYDEQKRACLKSIEILSSQKTQLESDIAKAQEALADISAQVRDLKLRAQKARALLDE